MLINFQAIGSAVVSYNGNTVSAKVFCDVASNHSDFGLNISVKNEIKDAIWLKTILERSYLMTIDQLEHSKVSCQINVELELMESNGNAIDSASLSIYAALKHFERLGVILEHPVWTHFEKIAQNLIFISRSNVTLRLNSNKEICIVDGSLTLESLSSLLSLEGKDVIVTQVSDIIDKINDAVDTDNKDYDESPVRRPLDFSEWLWDLLRTHLNATNNSTIWFNIILEISMSDESDKLGEFVNNNIVDLKEIADNHPNEEFQRICNYLIVVYIDDFMNWLL